MSTISSSRPAVHTSPKQRILDTIASQAGAGKISGTDQTALTSAVDDIDAGLTSGSSSGSSSTEGSSSTQRLAPSDLKSRIDDLIGNEVSNGTLTSDQATTLKSVFAQGGKDGSQGGVGGAGGPGGPPPGPPPSGQGSDDASSDDSTATSSTATSSTVTSSTSTSDLLASFIKQLQATQSQTSAYSAGGSSGGSKLASALLLDFEA